jgi:hypothetical protein
VPVARLVNGLCTVAALDVVFITVVVVPVFSPIMIVLDVPSEMEGRREDNTLDTFMFSVPVIVPMLGPRLSSASSVAFNPS